MDFDPYTEDGGDEAPQSTLPYPTDSEVKVLGINLDRFMTLDTHCVEHRKKAQMRLGILARISRRKWGLETGVLQIMHDTIVTSLLRYGLVVMGSCLPPDLVNKIDVCVVNVAARRITGLDSSVRIESLHFLAATSSYQNLYILHRAKVVGAILRAEGSSAKNRREKEIGGPEARRRRKRPQLAHNAMEDANIQQNTGLGARG